jgi:hypothetical protein
MVLSVSAIALSRATNSAASWLMSMLSSASKVST